MRRGSKLLQTSFDTRRLLDVVNAVNQVRYRIDGLRQDPLDLHGMAAELINEDYGNARTGGADLESSTF